MAEFAIIPASDDDAVYLAPRMRVADRLEAEAATGMDPLKALRQSMALAIEAWSGTADGEVICMFGVSAWSIAAGLGSPWLLGSDLVERHGIAFARRNRAIVRHWSTLFPVLRNFVDVRHVVAIRWLRWIGFDLHEPIAYGPAGMPFHPFEMRAA